MIETFQWTQNVDELQLGENLFKYFLNKWGFLESKIQSQRVKCRPDSSLIVKQFSYVLTVIEGFDFKFNFMSQIWVLRFLFLELCAKL